MVAYEGGDLLLAGAACAGGRAAARSMRVQAVGGDLSSLAPQFQLEVITHYALYKSTPLPLPFLGKKK